MTTFDFSAGARRRASPAAQAWNSRCHMTRNAVEELQKKAPPIMAWRMIIPGLLVTCRPRIPCFTSTAWIGST